MNDVGVVGMFDGIAQATPHRERHFGDLRRVALDEFRERRTVDKLHHDKLRTRFIVLTRIENLDDIGVMKFRNRLGFAMKTRGTLFLRGEKRVEELERHGAMKPHIARTKDDGHSPTTDFVFNFVSICDDAGHPIPPIPFHGEKTPKKQGGQIMPRRGFDQEISVDEGVVASFAAWRLHDA